MAGNNHSNRGRRGGYSLGQILYWAAFLLLVVVGVRAPGWIKYVGWALAAFFVARSVLGGNKRRR